MCIQPSSREHQILTFVCAGLTNKEIGNMLNVSARTVESHIRTLMRRYSARNRTHLASKYQRTR